MISSLLPNTEYLVDVKVRDTENQLEEFVVSARARTRHNGELSLVQIICDCRNFREIL